MALPEDPNPFEVARLDALPPKERNYREVARKLRLDTGKKVQNDLSRLVRQWEDDRKVQHVVYHEPADEKYLPLVPSLEDRLRRLYGLRDVVVVDTSSLARPDVAPKDGEELWNEYDDTIHEHLGVWGGRIVASLVRRNDIVGVGSGRGPFYTAEECKIPPTSAYYPLEVVALTGKMTAHYWGKGVHRKNKVRSLDADFIANSFVTGLGVNRPARYLDCAITSGQKVKPDRVTLAVIGIGALGGGHRLKHHANSDELEPVKAELQELNRLAEKVDPPVSGRGPFPHWIGDVCNSLFVVDGRVGQRTLEVEEREALETLVRKLNDRFVNTGYESLAEICRQGAVIAVAGGPHKVAAITHVVRQKEPWITHLVTDDETARHLLEEDVIQHAQFDKGSGI